MATNTTNFNLSKPAYTDTADIAVINNNMDKVDTALQGLGSGLAIISKNNTHVAITAGQYVYVHGHSSLAEGLYTAKSNIAANATLSTSNLQADGSGGLNLLNSKILPNTAYTGDLNNAPDGITYTNTGVSNTPANYDYWFVLTMLYSGSGAVGAQIAIGRTSSNPPMYFRVKSGGTWTNWTQVI